MNKRLHSRFRPRNAAPQNQGADFFTENVATRMKNIAASNSMIQLKEFHPLETGNDYAT
jgi:hypothetical protein